GGPVTILRGQYEGAQSPPETACRQPILVYAGRHIPEKRVTAIVPAFQLAREQVPELRCLIYGDGPNRPEVLRQIERWRVESVVKAPGFVGQADVEHALENALCLLLPSRREGYGLVVVEAFARGTP